MNRQKALYVLKLFLGHAEVVPQFVHERLADLVSDFCLARTDRFDLLLIKHDVAGPTDKSKTLFFVAGTPWKMPRSNFLGFPGRWVTGWAGNPQRESLAIRRFWAPAFS